ncbi:MAG: response regulator transcription factor [Cellulosilyticum sp.]|nr:response regulator transcription factor [Cellulosilyticum sp.]
MGVKVLLVDDEPGIRLLLSKIIGKTEGFEVVGECDTMTDAIKLFTIYKPEVVFLDIEIKGTSGLECAKIISDLNPKTKIIFATAHAQYMSEAFEVYAYDYLVKPFNVERVTRTLERVKMLDLKDKMQEESDKIIKYEKGLAKLLVKGKESMSFIDIKDIILVQRENGNTIIYTKKNAFSTSASLSDIEAKLDPDQFIRSHKSYLINLSEITKIEPYGRWSYVVKFKDIDKDALITGEKYEEIKNRFL